MSLKITCHVCHGQAEWADYAQEYYCDTCDIWLEEVFANPKYGFSINPDLKPPEVKTIE